MLNDRGPTHWTFFLLVNNSCSILIGPFTLSWRKSQQSCYCFTHVSIHNMIPCFLNIIVIVIPPPKNYMSRAFLTGELRIINIGKNEKSATRWPTVSKRMYIFFHLYPNSVVIRAVYWILFFGCFIIHELIKKYSENKKKSCILKYENLELKFAVNKSTNCICIFFSKSISYFWLTQHVDCNLSAL